MKTENKATKENFYIFEKKRSVNTSQGVVEMHSYTVESPSCYRRRFAKVGDRVRVVAGKKIPKGTVATIKYVKDNPYEHVQDLVTGDYYNPSILLTLDNGDDVWTSGKNLENVAPEGAIAGPLKFADRIEAQKELAATGKYTSTAPFWHISNKGEIFFESNSICDAGMSIKERKEIGDEIVMILDDWRSDTYPFLVIKKDFKPGNEVKYVRTGVDRRFSDVNDPNANGYKEAKKLFEDYKKGE